MNDERTVGFVGCQEQLEGVNIVDFMASKAKKAGVRSVQLVVDGDPARQIVRAARSRKS